MKIMKQSLQFLSVVVFVLILGSCNTKQMITYNIAGSWKMTKQTDTLGMDMPIGDWKIVYNFDKCSGHAADCGGNYTVTSTVGGGPAPHPTTFKWSLDGSYMTITIGTAKIKYNVMEVSKKNLTIQSLDYPRAHADFVRQ